MKLNNTSDFESLFLRRMVGWCCRQIGVPVRWVRYATFAKKRKGAYDGHGTGYWIRVRVGPDSAYPVKDYIRHGAKHPGAADRIEGLVSVTAHELMHVWQFSPRRHTARLTRTATEQGAIHEQTRVLTLFREQRESLLAVWSEQREQEPKPTISVQERRAVKANADLIRWQRKLKLATTKVRKLRKRVSYYEKATAATKSK